VTASRADQLRAAFDHEFALPHGTPAADDTELLAIRIAGEPYALRRADLAGLFAGKVITPLPGEVPALLGIGGFRGALVPVYDLRVLLGANATGVPRWLVTTAAAPVALAFDGFETFARVSGDAVVGHDGATGRVRHAARTTTGLRPIVDIPSILDAIRARARPRKD
jgi:chemotaxis signal transduction protein